MNLGTAEAWTLGRPDAPDAERHLRAGADLAREIGRPYLEVGCLAQLGFASLVLRSFATTKRRCREAIALAERYGWGAEPVIAPALIMLAGTMVWTGEFDEGERWLRRTERALRTPSTRTSAASTPSSRSVTATRPCGAPGSCGCWRRPAGRASPAVTGSR